MKLVDAHCHLESREFGENLDSVLEAGRLAGIAAFITASISPEQWDVSQGLSEQRPDVHFALGVHPWYAKERDLEAIPQLAEARARGAKAIGEIGLDGKIEEPSFDLQLRVFETQLEVARAIGLPVVMHCRGAFEELHRSIKRVGMPERGGVIHAFSGSLELAELFVQHNVSFSMGGSLTYRNSRKRQRVLERIYPDSFLLETDSPDIPPVEARGAGMPNTPANILYNLKAAAEMLERPPEEVAARTTANAARIFGLEIEN
jgi:TatD DNase family protein